jgi:hypothetical protein
VPIGRRAVASPRLRGAAWFLSLLDLRDRRFWPPRRPAQIESRYPQSSGTIFYSPVLRLGVASARLFTDENAKRTSVSCKMSVTGVRVARLLPELSTVHDSVIGINRSVPRFLTMKVPCVTESSCSGAYLPRQPESPFMSPRSVALQLRSVSERSVASREPSTSKRPVASALLVACIFPYRVLSSPASAPPRVALAPALQSLRRAALANKCQRIVGRLANRAAKPIRQQLQ